MIDMGFKASEAAWYCSFLQLQGLDLFICAFPVGERLERCMCPLSIFEVSKQITWLIRVIAQCTIFMLAIQFILAECKCMPNLSKICSKLAKLSGNAMQHFRWQFRPTFQRRILRHRRRIYGIKVVYYIAELRVIVLDFDVCSPVANTGDADAAAVYSYPPTRDLTPGLPRGSIIVVFLTLLAVKVISDSSEKSFRSFISSLPPQQLVGD